MDVEPLFEMIHQSDHTQSAGNDMEQSEVIFLYTAVVLILIFNSFSF